MNLSLECFLRNFFHRDPLQLREIDEELCTWITMHSEWPKYFHVEKHNEHSTFNWNLWTKEGWELEQKIRANLTKINAQEPSERQTIRTNLTNALKLAQSEGDTVKQEMLKQLLEVVK